MPKTTLSINAEELAKLRLLRAPFADLPFFKNFDNNLAQRARELYRRRHYTAYFYNKEVRATFCKAMQAHLSAKPCNVLEAMQSEEQYTRLTGLEQGYYPENRDRTENCWWRCYNPLFEAWQVDHRLEMFTSWDQVPTHVAGYYHLQEYGDQDLRSRDFDRPMASALLYEILHEAGVTTLTQLAALSMTDLYQHIQKCGYSQENRALDEVRTFLRRHYVDINTTRIDEPPT